MIVTIQVRNVPEIWVKNHNEITDPDTKLFHEIALLFNGLDLNAQVAAISALITKYSKDSKNSIESVLGKLYVLDKESKNK